MKKTTSEPQNTYDPPKIANVQGSVFKKPEILGKSRFMDKGDELFGQFVNILEGITEYLSIE